MAVDPNMLFDKGFDFANNCLSYLREKGEREERMHTAELEQQNEFNTRLLAEIDDVSRRLSTVAGDAAALVRLKLEKDRLEDLSAHIQSMKFAIEFGKEALLMPALASIAIQIAYAKSRLVEGKYEWLGTWMMAEAVRIAALYQVAGNDSAIRLAEREAKAFRLAILNFTGKSLVDSGGSHWELIADFVDGRNENYLVGVKEAKVFSAKNDKELDHVQATKELQKNIYEKWRANI